MKKLNYQPTHKYGDITYTFIYLNFNCRIY